MPQTTSREDAVSPFEDIASRRRAQAGANSALPGVDLLTDYLVNFNLISAGPARTTQAMRARYGIAPDDYLGAAQGLDAGESEELRARALERCAFEIGRRDGMSFVESVYERGDEVNVSREARECLERMDLFPGSGLADRVRSAYTRAVMGQASTMHVETHHASQSVYNAHQARFVIASGDPGLAHDYLKEAQVDVAIAESADGGYALATARHYSAEEAAYEVGEDAIERTVRDVAAENPGLHFDGVMQRARTEHRRLSSGGGSLGQAHQFVAWQGVSRPRMERAVRQAQTAAREHTVRQDLTRVAAM